MIFRILELSIGRDRGFAIGSILYDNGMFDAALAVIYNRQKKELFLCAMGWKWLFKIGEDNEG